MWFSASWFSRGWFGSGWFGGVAAPVPRPTKRFTSFYSRVEWLPKLQGEARIYAFDAMRWIEQGLVVSSIAIDAFTYMGSDPNPQNIVQGTAVLKGTQIQQMIRGGIVGAIYDVQCTVEFTDGQVRQQRAFLAVTKDVT